MSAASVVLFPCQRTGDQGFSFCPVGTSEAIRRLCQRKILSLGRSLFSSASPLSVTLVFCTLSSCNNLRAAISFSPWIGPFGAEGRRELQQLESGDFLQSRVRYGCAHQEKIDDLGGRSGVLVARSSRSVIDMQHVVLAQHTQPCSPSQALRQGDGNENFS